MFNDMHDQFDVNPGYISIQLPLFIIFSPNIPIIFIIIIIIIILYTLIPFEKSHIYEIYNRNEDNNIMYKKNK